jgi:uncharacterized protein
MSNVDKHNPGTPNWFDCMTPDLEGARKFYGELFGWTFIVGTEHTGYYTMCRLRDRNVAGMGKRPENAPYPPSWSVYFESTDVDADVARVRESGGKVMMEPMDVMEEGRMAFCFDPTGAGFGFWQGKRHKGAQIVDEPGAMAWCEVNTRDAKADCSFYEAVLGAQTMKMEGMDYYMIKKGEKVVAGILQMDAQWPAGIPPHWMPYFAVADTDASVERVKELGGSMKVPPFDTPYGRMSVVSDPYGATFSIIKLAQPG